MELLALLTGKKVLAVVIILLIAGWTADRARLNGKLAAASAKILRLNDEITACIRSIDAARTQAKVMERNAAAAQARTKSRSAIVKQLKTRKAQDVRGVMDEQSNARVVRHLDDAFGGVRKLP